MNGSNLSYCDDFDVKFYLYDEIIECMDDIYKHPGDYAELLDDMNAIGYTKQIACQRAINKLTNFVNNHILETTMAENLGLKFVDPHPERLEIRNGINAFDFHNTLFKEGTGIELKLAHSLGAAIRMKDDIKEWRKADDKRDFNNWLKATYNRHVNFHNATYVLFCIPRNNAYVILDTEKDEWVKTGYLNLKRPLFECPTYSFE